MKNIFQAVDHCPKGGIMKKWKMPKWMEPFREHISNTGGNSIEDLMNNHTATLDNNAILAMLCVAVKSQVILLERLYKNRLLP